MLIDWFTVLAQIVNFLILVWLLKRFLYKPILAAMDAREKRIADQLREAETKAIEAEQQRVNLLAAQEQFASEKQAMLQRAEMEAEVTRQRLSDELRQEITTQRADWLEALQRERANIRNEVTDSVQREVFSITRQTLRDLADEQLEPKIVAAFLARLSHLTEDDRRQFAGYFEASRNTVVIRSAFELPDALRRTITEAVRDNFAIDGPLRFETNSAVLGGIELLTNGHKISWSINGYLASLEESLDHATAQTASTHEKTE
jgi:F-type H+-transporting ATPase subunit b